jgi:hypothetical protein
MKFSTRFFVLLFLAISPKLFASISCSEPKLSKVTNRDSIYHFKAVATCNLVNEKINLTTLKDAYKSDILATNSEFKVHAQHDYDDQKGMHGYWLDVTQSYETDHGPLAVRAEILLLDDNAKKFFVELKSKSIKGEGDAAYNHSILNDTTLQIFPDHAELTIVKEIDVQEPWYAPHGMFMNTVEEELLAATSKSAKVNAQKICGQKVDALKK